MKIGFVLDTSLDPNDGVQQYVLAVGQWLTAQGHDVHYLVGETVERQLPNIHSLCRNITVQFNGNRTTIPVYASRRKLRKFLREQHFDVLHVQTPHHPLMAQHIVLEAESTTAVVGTFHILPYNALAKYANKLLGLTLQPSLRRFDQMLAVSPKAAIFEKWSFGRDARVLPNVFDYPRFQTAQPFERYEDDTLTILFFGRLVERKGCRYLLEAITKLDHENLPKFRVVICGKGELQSELERYVHEHGLTDIVEFTGFVSEDDKPRYYASADISVFPSTGGESFGIVLLEAMASGRAAVLAGNNPGYASVMEPQPDLLFDPRDTDALAALLRTHLTDSAVRKAAAVWGTEYTKQFDIAVVGPELIRLYEALHTNRKVG